MQLRGTERSGRQREREGERRGGTERVMKEGEEYREEYKNNRVSREREGAGNK